MHIGLVFATYDENKQAIINPSGESGSFASSNGYAFVERLILLYSFRDAIFFLRV